MKTRQKLRKGIILFSFFLFPATFYYFSPVVVIRAATNGIVNGSFIVFLLLLVSALFLGRAYCGWACPAAGCQEALFLSQEKKVTGGDAIKWMIWIPWVVSIPVVAAAAGGYREIDFFYDTRYGLSIGDPWALMAYLVVVVLLIVCPAMIFGKRSFCHHVCWMAPFMIIGRKAGNALNWPSLRLRAASETCTHCHTCNDHCPMSLPVEEMVAQNQMENPECILCGTCVDGCRHRVIEYSFLNRSKPADVGETRVRHRPSE